MSDARLRELERGDDAGDFAARVRLLAERLRVGAITPEQVGLAAFVGDAAARTVAGDAAPPVVRGLNQWWIALAGHDAQVAARSFCAVAALAVAPEHEPVLRRLMDWCVCPCDVHTFLVSCDRIEDRDRRQQLSAHLVWSAGLATREFVGPARLQVVHSTVQRLAQHGIAGPRLRAAIRSPLVPWLLGDGDPLLGDRPETLRGAWTCALLTPREDLRGFEALCATEDPTPELRQLDALWTARLAGWQARRGWSIAGPGPGGVSVERTSRAWIIRSFARWSAFVSDVELRRAHLPGVSAVARRAGATSLVWAPDDVALATAARDGADLDALVATLSATRGPPASSRLEDDALHEGPSSWWHVPMPT